MRQHLDSINRLLTLTVPQRREFNRRLTQKILFAWQICGLIAIVGFSAAIEPWSLSSPAGLRPVMMAALIAGAAMFCGFIVGFLFGIPKSRSLDVIATNDATRSGEVQLTPNTNLEQISDWLTKILVGVGLAQVKEIGPSLWRIADVLAEGMGGPPGVKPFIVAIIIYYVPCGFLSGYFWTRMFLAGAFSLADAAAVNPNEGVSSAAGSGRNVASSAPEG
jgi:hypothetical protein